jgi:antirestriction protein ArdC
MGQELIELVEQGRTGKWEQEWEVCPSLPYNPVSKHRYSGNNLVILLVEMARRGLNDPRFMTFQQARTIPEHPVLIKDGEEVQSDRTCFVRKGARGIMLVRPQVINANRGRMEDADDEETLLGGGSPEDDGRRVIFRTFHAFSAADIEGMPPLKDLQPRVWGDHNFIERLIAASGVEVVHGSEDAAFSPSRDRIKMPEKAAFPSQAAYYGVLLHEWYHATGHKSREDRFSGQNLAYGSKDYAKEELRAELFSVFVGSALGLPIHLENSAAYLKGWNEDLKDDPKEVMRQAVKASKMFEVVLDYAAGVQPEKADWFPSKSEWPTLVAGEDLPQTISELLASRHETTGSREVLANVMEESSFQLNTSYVAEGFAQYQTTAHGDDTFGFPGAEDLAAAEALQKEIEEQMPGAMVVIDTEGAATFVNVSLPQEEKEVAEDELGMRM